MDKHLQHAHMWFGNHRWSVLVTGHVDALILFFWSELRLKARLGGVSEREPKELMLWRFTGAREEITRRLVKKCSSFLQINSTKWVQLYLDPGWLGWVNRQSTCWAHSITYEHNIKKYLKWVVFIFTETQKGFASPPNSWEVWFLNLSWISSLGRQQEDMNEML